MSDNTFLLSSPSTVYSLGLDYEQSQHKQEIRDAREAEMTPEELQAAAEQRRMKRVKLGIESPQYKKEESSPSHKWRVTSPNAWTAADSSRTPVRTPRASAVKSREETSRAFMHHGPLDSQATSQEAIDALIDARLRDGQQDTVFDPDDVTSQDFLPMLDYRRQPVVYDHDISEEPESYEALRARCFQAEMQRDEVVKELQSCRYDYIEAVAAKNHAEEELARWKRAAVAAAPLADLIASLTD
ncbi:hypothetical protein FB451DRAFT_1237944 [Mycena latifolia]|nr:hypothetical protein FB451DRAFT_1237944 [Mycena latifolia]